MLGGGSWDNNITRTNAWKAFIFRKYSLCYKIKNIVYIQRIYPQPLLRLWRPVTPPPPITVLVRDGSTDTGWNIHTTVHTDIRSSIRIHQYDRDIDLARTAKLWRSVENDGAVG